MPKRNFSRTKKETIPLRMNRYDPLNLLILSFIAPLNVKPIIRGITVNTELLSSLKANPVRPGGFPAALAYIGIKQTRLLRQRKLRFLHVKHILGFQALIVRKRFFLCHGLRLLFQDQPHRFSCSPVVKGKRLFSRHMKQ